MRQLALIAMLALAGCATTPRGDATNVCNFVFFASLHAVLPIPPVAYAGVCTFGLELISDDAKVRPGVGKKTGRKPAPPASMPTIGRPEGPAQTSADPLRETLDQLDEEDEEDDEDV